MPPIAPVPSTRVSDLLIRGRLLSQLNFDQKELFRLQTQLSTGRRISLPSEDAPAALRAAGLQQLIERKDQIRINLSTNESYLRQTDSVLNDVTDTLVDIRAASVSVVDTVRTDQERLTVADQVDEAIRQLLIVGNNQFRGRYLFSGTRTAVQPFEAVGTYVQYHGNEGRLPSYADLKLLFDTNVNGSEVFGAISEPVRGSVDVNPVLTEDTFLSDLNGGAGITSGSIAVSDGTNLQIVDISGAVTIGEVAKMLEANPPASRTITANVTPTGLTVELDAVGGGKLTITEVGGGTTARDLGILEEAGVIAGPVVGDDLNPVLRPTTPLDNILGSRASAQVISSGANNDLNISAANNGSQLNGAAIQFVNDALLQAAPGITAGNEFVQFDPAARAAQASLALAEIDNDIIITAVNPGTDFNNVAIELVDAGDVKNNPTATYVDAGGVRTLTLGIDDSDETTLNDLINAIQATGLFTVFPDASAGEGFVGTTAVLTSNVGAVNGNTSNSGGNANTLYVHVEAGVSTANGVIQAINTEGTFTAQTDSQDTLGPLQEGTGPIEINATAVTSGGSGISLDKTSGILVSNGGQSYALSFATAETVEDMLNIINGSKAGLLAQINADGNGIDVRSTLSGSDFSIGENGGTTAEELGIRTFTREMSLAELNMGLGVDTIIGTDFTIERNDGQQLSIDVSGVQTIGEVIDLINNHPNNQDSAAVLARLAEFGNGIELVDDNPSGVDASGQPNQLKVLRESSSLAAVHLGLVPNGQQVSTLTSPASAPTAVADLIAPNTDLTFTATAPGTQFGGMNIVLVNSAAVGDQALVSYDGPSNTLTIDVDPANTRAITIVNAVDAEGTVDAELNIDNGPNDGSGIVTETGQVAVLSSGTPETLTGADVNPEEVEGVFNTLIRLKQALRENNLSEIERTVGMLKADMDRIIFTRAEIGARQQGLDVISQRLETEEIELKRALSEEIDVELAEAISNLTARQFAFQASLKTTATLLQLTILDFI